MKIGIDFDEVIAEFIDKLLEHYNGSSGKSLRKEDFSSYNLWEMWGGTREEAIKIVDEFHDSPLFSEINPSERALEAIDALLKNNELFIITARPARFKTKTEEWLRKHLPDKNFHVVYSGDFHKEQASTKAQICKELGVTLMIEDSPHTALDCINNNIKVILFNKPWNKSLEHKEVVRVNNWEEALIEIEKYYYSE